MLDLGMNLVGSNRPLTARPKEQPKAVVSRPGSGRPQSGRLRPAAARALAAANANRPASTHGGRPPPQPPPKPTPPPKPLELEAPCSFGATLEPLVHLLQPLLKASRKDDQQNGTLTLQVLLTAASLASTCGKDPGARPGRPSWKVTVQGQTTVRRARALVTAMRGSPRKDEKERALADLCLLLKSAPSAAAAALDEGVVLLVELADCGSLKAKEHAASLLKQMAGSDAGRSAVAQAGGIAPLVKLVAAQARPPRLEAAAALAALACGHTANQDAIAAAGALTHFLKMLAPDHLHAYSEQEQLAAATAVCALAARHAANSRLVVSHGGTARLASFIRPRLVAVARLGDDASASGRRRGDDALNALHALLRQHSPGAEPPPPAPSAPADAAAAEALRRLVGGLPSAQRLDGMVDELLGPLVTFAQSGGRGAPATPRHAPPRPATPRPAPPRPATTPRHARRADA